MKTTTKDAKTKTPRAKLAAIADMMDNGSSDYNVVDSLIDVLVQLGIRPEGWTGGSDD